MCQRTEPLRRLAWPPPRRVIGRAIGLGGLLLVSGLLLLWLAVAPARGGEPGRAGGLPPPPAPAPLRSATTPIYVLAGAPTCPNPERPCGVPLARTDWVVTRDYAAHGGPGPWGALDFAFWWNRDASGTPVLATHRGRVRGITGDATYGNRAYVQNARWTTIYSHLQTILVPDDQWVERGQLIGLMGSTGKSTGTHVDYQVWEDSNNHNPHDYCACAQAGSDPVPLGRQPPAATGGR